MTGRDNASAIDLAREAYASLREYVDGIDEADLLLPNRVGVWSGKDLVVHIAIGEKIAAQLLDDLSAGSTGHRPPDDVDINELNEQRVSEHAGMSLQETLDFWQTRHEELVDAFGRSTVEREDILLTFTLHHYRAHYPDFRHVKPFQPLSDDAREKLLADMDVSHAAFLALIKSIPEEALLAGNTVGVWSGQDLIAHLGHWQQAAIDLTRELENDRPGKWPGEDGSNINDWNQVQVESMRDESLDGVRAYQQDRYNELRALIASSPFATRAAGIGATEFHYGLHEEDFRSLTD